MVKRGVPFALVLLLRLPAGAETGPQRGQPAPQDSLVVAEVGDSRIFAAAVQEHLIAARRRDAAAGRLESFGALAAEQTLQKLIDARLLALAAREQGIDQQPAVRRRLEHALDQFLAEILIEEQTAELTEHDGRLRAYYDAHPEAFRRDARVRARHLVVRTEAEAARLVEALERGEDFAQLASKHNIDSTRSTGGDLGWVRRGVMVAAFERGVFALKVGEISPVIRTSYGFHIVKAEAIDRGKLPPFQAVKDVVKQKLMETRIVELKERLTSRYPVKVHRELLDQIGR